MLRVLTYLFTRFGSRVGMGFIVVFACIGTIMVSRLNLQNEYCKYLFLIDQMSTFLGSTNNGDPNDASFTKAVCP